MIINSECKFLETDPHDILRYVRYYKYYLTVYFFNTPFLKVIWSWNKKKFTNHCLLVGHHAKQQIHWELVVTADLKYLIENIILQCWDNYFWVWYFVGVYPDIYKLFSHKVELCQCCGPLVFGANPCTIDSATLGLCHYIGGTMIVNL